MMLEKVKADAELYDERIRAGVPEAVIERAFNRKLAELEYNLHEKQVLPIVGSVEAVLAKDPELFVYDSRYEFPYREESFIFGKKTVAGLMGLTYGCKRCGTCCENQLGERCMHLEDPEAKTKTCTNHGKPDYPLQCALYPFIISERAIAGQGRRFIRLRARKDLSTDFTFDFMDHFALQITPHNAGWLQGPTTVKELWAEAKQKVMKWSGPLMPPLFESDAEQGCGYFLDEVRAALLKGKQPGHLL